MQKKLCLFCDIPVRPVEGLCPHCEARLLPGASFSEVRAIRSHLNMELRLEAKRFSRGEVSLGDFLGRMDELARRWYFLEEALAG